MIRSIVESILPGRCPGCRGRGEPVCRDCALELPRAVPTTRPRGLDSMTTVFAFEGIVRQLLTNAKYRNSRHVLPWLAAEIAHCLEAGRLEAGRLEATGLEAAGLGSAGFSVVTWAPTTPARRRARGFDQAELLARCLGSASGFRARRLLRRLPGSPQTGLSRAERFTGPMFVGTASIVGAEVLIVDDVMTTGATLAAAAATLRMHGAMKVHGAAVALTP